MKLVALALSALMLVLPSVTGAQQGGGGLGGVLDALGGILGGAPQKLHGTVVVARDTTLVVRGDDRRTYRIDTASVDPAVRQSLKPGDTVTVVTRGGQGNVLAATEIQRDTPGAAAGSDPFKRVSGTVEEATANEVVFRTRDGLVLPVDTSQIRGLPFIAPNQPATLIYEQGPRREVVGVWIEPADTAQPSASPSAPPASGSASPPSASAGNAREVRGMVESIGMANLRLQTNTGDSVTVDTANVDRAVLDTIRPGDVVTVTGSTPGSGDRFVAQTIRPENRARP